MLKNDVEVLATRYPINGNIRFYQNQFQYPTAVASDIYLNHFDLEMNLLDSVKIHPDSLGANQRRPKAITALNEQFLAIWRTLHRDLVAHN